MILEQSSKVAENKIIILYTMNKFDIPLLESQLTHFILEKTLMNYFIFKQNLSELNQSNLIESFIHDGLASYRLTSLGHKTLDMFSNLLSDDFKQFVSDEVSLKKKQFMTQNEIIANYTQLKDNEYAVHLMAIENGTPLMELRLTLFSEEQCIKICTNWKKGAPDYFKKIIQMIT